MHSIFQIVVTKSCHHLLCISEIPQFLLQLLYCTFKYFQHHKYLKQRMNEVIKTRHIPRISVITLQALAVYRDILFSCLLVPYLCG